MSLLMDALRRAEQEKQAQEARSAGATDKGETDGDTAASARGVTAGPDDITLQIAPEEVAAASGTSFYDSGESLELDLGPGDDSRVMTRELSGDDSSAFDLADDGTDSGAAVRDGDGSRSMSLDDLSLEPIEGIEAFEQDDDDDLAGDDTHGGGHGDDGAGVPGGTTVGARPRADQTGTIPSARAVQREVNAYFDQSQSMEAPRARLNSDFTLQDVAAHTVVGAQTVFRASRRPRGNRLFIAAGVIAVLCVLGIGAVALFYAQHSSVPRTLPSPTVADGVERPLPRELPVVPLEQQPTAAAATPVPRVETATAPAVAAAMGDGTTAAPALEDTAAVAGSTADAAAPPASLPAAEAVAAPAQTPAAALTDTPGVSAIAGTAGTALEAPRTAAAAALPAATSPAAVTSAPTAPATKSTSAAVSAPVAAALPALPPPLADVGAGEVRIARSRRAAAVDADVEAAYTAYQAGDLETARARYGAALAAHPDQRDALLGLGAVALAGNDLAEAYRRYAQVLQAHPGDPVASAALFGITGGDGAATAARLRVLLDERGDNPYVQFALGNWYARQQRWGDAQQAYFEAFRLAPDNADYAYNLAVSLDRMGQGKAALGYYQKSLGLADAGNAAFNPAGVLARIQSLTTAVGP